jgi:hypothetical protein
VVRRRKEVRQRQTLASEVEKLAIRHGGYDAILSVLEELLREGYPATSDAVKTARHQLETEGGVDGQDDS